MIGAPLLVAMLVACTAGEDLSPSIRARLLKLGPLPAVPQDPTNRYSDDPKAAEFGRVLFYDKRLSKNNEVSCATCHQPDRAFSDGQPLAKGIEVGTRHTPSILNAAYQRWLTWDGSADSLWSQALHPFTNPREMGLTHQELVGRVASIPELRINYEKIFGPMPQGQDDPRVMTACANLGKAIAAFERRLVTGPAPFDRWLAQLRTGNEAPTDFFNAASKRGAILFVGKADCVRCHAGPTLSDGEFHLIGVPQADGAAPTDRGRLQGIEKIRKDPFNAAGSHSDAPEGSQAKITRSTAPEGTTWGSFRTPSLRTAAASPPFMHLGQLASLEAVIDFYNTLQGATNLDHHSETVLQPLNFTAQEQADLVSFLNSLQGSLPKQSETGDPKGGAPQETSQSDKK